MKNLFNKIKSNKKLTILTISLITIIGVSLAYLIPQLMDGAFSGADIFADSVDKLEFVAKDYIHLSVNQFTLAPGKSNLSATATATASLIANNTKNTATYGYYVYFDITKNEFIYTKDESTPEIVLTITDPNNQIITSIDGLTYNETLQGFDITTKTGVIKVADNYSISATNITQTIQNWTFTVTFINLDSDQIMNAEKEMYAAIIIQKEIYNFGNACRDDAITTCIKDNYKLDPSIIYHDTTEDNKAGDLSYRYSGGDHDAIGTCTYKGNNVVDYLNKTKTTTTYSKCKRIYKDSSSDIYYDQSFETYFYNPPVSIEWDGTENLCKTSDTGKVVTDFGDNLISQENCSGFAYQYMDDADYYIAGIEFLGKGDFVEIIPEERVNNYVCLAYEEPCPDDYLYRIIGIFDENKDGIYSTKLIKHDYATSEQLGTDGNYLYSYLTGFDYAGDTYKGSNYKNIATYIWNNTTNKNIWSTSILNITNLNVNYMNYLKNERYSILGLIEDTTWQVGACPTEYLYDGTASVAHSYEVGANSSSTTYNAQIGLMYVSDYGYAASPEYWGTPLVDYGLDTVTQNNWMYMGLDEWTITRTDGVDGVYRISKNGDVQAYLYGGYRAIRPVFYLDQKMCIVSGAGTYINPYRIGWIN